MVRSEEQTAVWDGLRRLKPLDRATLLAFYIRGQSLQEMSAEFETPIGTIKRRLHVARKRLAQQLEEFHDRLGDGIKRLFLREDERVADLEHGKREREQSAGDDVGHDQRQSDFDHGLEGRAAEILGGVLERFARLLKPRGG